MLGGIGREARLVGAARLLWGLADGILVIAVPLYLIELGAGPSDVGRVLGTTGALGALLILPAGILARRVGRRPVLAFSTTLGLVGTLLFLPLGAWQGAYLASAVYWSSVAVLPLMNAHVAATQSPGSLGRAMGFSYAVSMLGLIVAPSVAGWVAAAVGLRAPIALAAVAYLGMVMVVLLLRPDRPPASASPPAAARAIPWTYWGFLPPVLALTGVLYLPIVLLPVYLRDVTALSLPGIGLYIAVMNVGATALSALGGYAVDRVGARGLLGAAAAVALGAIALIGEAPWLALTGMFLLGAQIGANPILASLVSRMLVPDRLAIGYGTLQLATRLGLAASAVAAGILYESDPRLPLLVAATLALPAASAVVLVASRITPPGAPGVAHERMRSAAELVR